MKWKNYFFTVDFTREANYLKTKEVGHIFHGEDADILSQVLERADNRRKETSWNAKSHQCHFNVVGAVVKYNDVNRRDFKTNSKFTHVLVLKFPENNFCPQGEVTLQYNGD